jgi:ubiquitin-like protein Pup
VTERELKKRSTPKRDETTEEVHEPQSAERGERLKAEIDDLLDEIDEVLEDNAEEFVRNYVQKGGE